MRKKISSSLKAKVAIEALKGLKSVAEIASLYEVHPNRVCAWKKQFLEASEDVFSPKKAKRSKEEVEEKETLYRKIGQLEVENDFLKKKWNQLKSR